MLSAGCCLADEVVVRSEALEGGAVELLLMVGVGDADDGFGSLLEGLAVEVHSTVLGYEPVDVVAGGHDTGAGGEDGSDLVTTPAPEVRTGAILLTPLLVTEGMAMMALPPLERDAP